MISKSKYPSEKYLKHESKLKTKLLWSKLDKSIKIKKLVEFASVWVNKNYTELSKKGDKISTIKEIEEVLTKYLKTALQRKKLSKNKNNSVLGPIQTYQIGQKVLKS